MTQAELEERVEEIRRLVKTRPIGSWVDNPCYYVSIIDGERWALILGPFRTHQEALDMVDKARDVGCEIDRKSHFYGWGTCKVADGRAVGVLNKYFDI